MAKTVIITCDNCKSDDSSGGKTIGGGRYPEYHFCAKCCSTGAVVAFGSFWDFVKVQPYSKQLSRGLD